MKLTREQRKDVIIKECCKLYNVSFDDINIKLRKRELVLVRQVIMYMLKSFTNMTLHDIGGVFTKDHATVLHGIRTINNLIETDRVILEKMAVLRFIIETKLKESQHTSTIIRSDLVRMFNSFPDLDTYLIIDNVFKVPEIQIAYIDNKGNINFNQEEKTWKQCLIIQ